MALITCTHCGASGNAPDQILGQQVRCSKCKQSFLAGGDNPPPAPASPFAVDDEPEAPPEEEGEGFPTNEDIGRPPARRAPRRDDDEEEVLPSQRHRKPAAGGGFVDFLMFRRMVAPYLIIIMFWLMLIGVIVSSLGMIADGFTAGTSGIPVALGGVAYLVIGPLGVRLWCEVLIVIFRIHDTLSDIHGDMRKED